VAPVNLVWEDHGYGLIAWKQKVEFGRTSHTQFRNPDLVALSQSFGCHARRVGAPDELRAALREAFAVRDRPSVVVVPVDYSENVRLTERLGNLLAH
jgi:acetolactate synthase I/II/III large subunit